MVKKEYDSIGIRFDKDTQKLKYSGFFAKVIRLLGYKRKTDEFRRAPEMVRHQTVSFGSQTPPPDYSNLCSFRENRFWPFYRAT